MQTKRRKKYIESVMTMFMAFFICMTSFAQESSMVQHSAAKNLIWEKKLERQVTFLSDTICQGRGTGSRASKEAHTQSISLPATDI